MNSHAQSSSSSTDAMEEILKQYPINIPQVGQDVTGKVIEIGTNNMYVDLGSLGTGIILGQEIHDGFGTVKELSPGDPITATVIDLNTDDGYIELSMRAAAEDKVWEDLYAKYESEEPVGVKILDANKGGLLIQMNGIGGFLPVSQLAYDHYPRIDGGDKNKILSRLQDYIGQTFRVAVINVNREENKLIVSEKVARKSEELDLINSYKPGDRVEGEVTGVVDFGVFIKFGETEQKIEGLIHISELSWQLVENPRDLYKEGDQVKAEVIDVSNGKISLSIKKILEDPWQQIAKQFQPGQIVSGKVVKSNHFGVFVQLQEDIRGLVHNSEIDKNRSQYAKLKPGSEAEFKILSIEPQDHRISLTLAE